MRQAIKAALLPITLLSVANSAFAAKIEVGSFNLQSNRFRIDVNGIDDILECRAGKQVVLLVRNGEAKTTVINALQKGVNDVTCDVTDSNRPTEREAGYSFELFGEDGKSLGGLQKAECNYAGCQKNNPVYTLHWKITSPEPTP